MTEKIETTSVPQIEPPDQQTNSDCFRCALAGLLGQPYEAVPDFYGDEIRAHGSPNAAWHRLQAWLQAQGLVAVEFPENVPLNLVPEGTRAILTGRSPRVPDWDHSVLGEWREGSWRIVHDPHPSRAGFKGGVKVLTFVALANPAALLQRAWMAQPPKRKDGYGPSPLASAAAQAIAWHAVHNTMLQYQLRLLGDQPEGDANA